VSSLLSYVYAAIASSLNLFLKGISKGVSALVNPFRKVSKLR
jgi:hypothetical protein